MFSRRPKKPKASKWFKVDTITGFYYANSPGYEIKRFVVGDGEEKPKPYQLLDLINKLEAENETNFRGIYENNHVYGVELPKTVNEVELPPGTYIFHKECMMTGRPERLVPVDFRKDKYIRISNITDEITNDIREFMASEMIYRDLEIIYKTGILLYGAPGEGKTALIRNVVKEELPADAIAICIDDVIPSTSFLASVNASLKDRFKVFILEEFTHFVQDRYDMESVLTFLDGEASVDKSITIATTNYPEVLPPNIVERPSRFDKLYKVDGPDADARNKLLTYFLGREATAEEIKFTDGQSSDAIKNLCILSRRKKCSVKEASDTVKKHMEIAKKNFAPTPKHKFGLN